MNHTTLRRDAALFREGMLEDNPSTDMCYVMSISLAGWLSFSGTPCKAVEGLVLNHHHWWIQLEDGAIIDATADQFKRPNGRAMPKVYVGPKPRWYKLLA